MNGKIFTQLLIGAFSFATLPVTVFFLIQSKFYLDLTSNFKNSTSEAMSAVGAIVTAHIIIGYFLYAAYNYSPVKVRKE